MFFKKNKEFANTRVFENFLTQGLNVVLKIKGFFDILNYFQETMIAE